MAKLCVKNFGPIVNGFSNNGNDYIDFNKVTIFIGEQGSGKSTIAKLYSTFNWIEKNLCKEKIKAKDIDYPFFIEQLKFHKIENFFPNKKTYIDFIGSNYRLTFDSDSKTIQKIFTAKHLENSINYVFPKIMYVPAERNFISSIENTYNLKYLSKNLNQFLIEFENAKLFYSDNTVKVQLGFKNNLNEIDFFYDKTKKNAYLSGHNFRIKLSEASSGYQSSIPLQIVTEYLTNFIHDDDLINNSLSVEDQINQKNEISSILNKKLKLKDEEENEIEFIKRKYNYEKFVNIVEEPEQNLFPKSQKYILYKLIDCANQNDLNELVLTTHSPYLLMHLTLAIKAFKINKVKNSKSINKKLEMIVPLKSKISPKLVSIFQLDNEGNIFKLEDYNGLPTDENYLNELMIKSNEEFTELLKLEKNG